MPKTRPFLQLYNFSYDDVYKAIYTSECSAMHLCSTTGVLTSIAIKCSWHQRKPILKYSNMVTYKIPVLLLKKN